MPSETLPVGNIRDQDIENLYVSAPNSFKAYAFLENNKMQFYEIWYI